MQQLGKTERAPTAPPNANVNAPKATQPATTNNMLSASGTNASMLLAPTNPAITPATPPKTEAESPK
jgi:hypothetical protein